MCNILVRFYFRIKYKRVSSQIKHCMDFGVIVKHCKHTIFWHSVQQNTHSLHTSPLQQMHDDNTKRGQPQTSHFSAILCFCSNALFRYRRRHLFKMNKLITFAQKHTPFFRIIVSRRVVTPELPFAQSVTMSSQKAIELFSTSSQTFG